MCGLPREGCDHGPVRVLALRTRILVLAGAVAVGLSSWVPAALGSPTSRPLSGSDVRWGVGPLVDALPALLGIAIVGRIALALLPPGAPGGARPRDLGTVWAASHLLGLAVVAVQGTALAGAGYEFGPAWLLPWLLVAVLVRALGPGKLRPRHEPAPPEEDTNSRGLAGALVAAAILSIALAARGGPGPEIAFLSGARAEVALVVGATTPTPPPAWLALLGFEGVEVALPVTSWIAMGLLVAHALRRAQRPLAEGRAVLLVLALAPASATACREGTTELVLAAFFGGGCALLPGWFRAADRRSLVLALALFGAGSLVHPQGLLLAVAAVTGTVLVTPESGRRRVVPPAAASILVFGATSVACWPLVKGAGSTLTGSPGGPLGLLVGLLDPLRFGAAPLLAAATALFAVPAAYRRAESDPSEVELLPLLGAATVVGGGALLLFAASFSGAPTFLYPSVLSLVPGAAVLLGLALLPPTTEDEG